MVRTCAGLLPPWSDQLSVLRVGLRTERDMWLPHDPLQREDHQDSEYMWATSFPPSLSPSLSLSLSALKLPCMSVCVLQLMSSQIATFIPACVFITAAADLLNELSNDGARAQFEKYLQQNLLHAMVKCTQVRLQLSNVVGKDVGLSSFRS